MSEIFRTVHGSNLYGFAHAGSDYDVYIVTDHPRQRLRQHIDPNTGLDVVTVGWQTLLDYARTGSHQSCEALFSREKVWTDTGLYHLIENQRVLNGEAYLKYERTIRKFCHGNFKRRRHAVRLWYNLRDLRLTGRFNPTLDAHQVRTATWLARLLRGRVLIWVLRMQKVEPTPLTDLEFQDE